MSEPLAPEDFPGPHGLRFVGNVRAIDLAHPIESLMSLAREYGPIFKLTSPAGISVVVSGVDLVSEICDDARFDKVITAGLSILAKGPVDAGLFTAHTDDPMWARAHGISAQRQFEEDQAFMACLVDDLIRKRRAMGDAADNTDLLGRMITGVDKQTGLTLPDENIRAQCLTFLIAGHETTSGLLSFAIYFLLEHPEYLDRAREEVDRVLGGTRLPTFDQLHELIYLRQVLDEALRLWPTASGFRRHAREDTVIGGGRYAIPKDLGMMVLSPMLHRDKSVWGRTRRSSIQITPGRTG